MRRTTGCTALGVSADSCLSFACVRPYSYVFSAVRPSSRALLDELCDHIERPDFTYAHRWRAGDILIWDNRCTLHRGTAYDYRHHKRDMRRATVNESGADRSAIPAELSLQMLAEPARASTP